MVVEIKGIDSQFGCGGEEVTVRLAESWVCTMLAGSQSMLIEVKSARSKNESRATIHRWNSEEWKAVYSIVPFIMTTPKDLASKWKKASGPELLPLRKQFDADIDRLRRKAAGIIFGGGESYTISYQGGA